MNDASKDSRQIANREKTIEGHSQGWRELSSTGCIFIMNSLASDTPKGIAAEALMVIK